MYNKKVLLNRALPVRREKNIIFVLDTIVTKILVKKTFPVKENQDDNLRFGIPNR